MLETRAMQVNLFFGSECKQFSILTGVIEQPWTGQLEQRRIVLGGRESQESELFFCFYFIWLYVEELTAVLPSFTSFHLKIWVLARRHGSTVLKVIENWPAVVPACFSQLVYSVQALKSYFKILFPFSPQKGDP